MSLTKEQKITLYTNMVRVRKLDEFMVKAGADGKLVGRFYHSLQGQEAIGTGACTFLKKDDYLSHTHRGHGIGELIPKGVDMKKIVAEHYGKATGSCRGMAFINTCFLEGGVAGLGGTAAGGTTLVDGYGLAAKFNKRGQVSVCLFGDGDIGEGSIHTAFLMSANWKLPIIWLCVNNGINMWVPTNVSYPKENIADMAFAYGMPSSIVDGQDVLAVYKATQAAVEKARAGEGPIFIEFKTCRFRPHVEGLPDFCLDGLRDEKMVNEWKKRDPIKLCREKLLEDGTLTQADVERIDSEAQKEVEEAEKFAEESPIPGPEILEDALYSK